MAATPNTKEEQSLQRDESPSADIHVRELAPENSAQHASPAKILQARLRNEIMPRTDKYSPRLVTTLLILFCAMSWAGAYLLYSMM